MGADAVAGALAPAGHFQVFLLAATEGITAPSTDTRAHVSADQPRAARHPAGAACALRRLVPGAKLCVMFFVQTGNQASAGITCLHCGQLGDGVARWLDTHWRVAKVICLDFRGEPADGTWQAAQPASASPAASARVLRVTCTRSFLACDEWRTALPRWVAGVLPLCQNLTALHLRDVQIPELPTLPHLVHLILQTSTVQPLLASSLHGLARLETLHVAGFWRETLSVGGARLPNMLEWDLRACSRLRRVVLAGELAWGLAATHYDLWLPPACTVAVHRFPHWEELRGWLVRLGSRVTNLDMGCYATELTARTTFMHAPELSQLRHVTLSLRHEGEHTLCVARLLGGLPQGVESLHLDYPGLSGKQGSCVVPASLRALRITGYSCTEGRACHDAPCQLTKDLTLSLHASLERLCLVLWGARVGLHCLDAGAPASLRGLNVQARAVELDSHLAAEVAQRGRVLERCDVVDDNGLGDSEWEVLPRVQVVYIGRGSVHMEARLGRYILRHWPCTCGACAECLGPEPFGGVADVAP